MIGSNKRWWTLVAACAGVLMVLIDVTIVNVALPSLQRDLHAKFEELQWVVNAYALPLAVVLVTAGRLSDIYGRRRLFVIGVVVFSAGSALAGLSGLFHFDGFPQIDALLAARAIQGVGGAVLVPVSLAIVSQAFEGRDKSTAIGVRGAMTGFGLAAGPILGGLLIVHFGWPSIFFINVPVGVLVVIASYALIDESRDEAAPHAVDWWGTVALSAAIFLLVWGLIRLDGMLGAPWWNVGWPFAAALIAFVAFFAIERRAAAPLVDLTLFRNASFAGAAGVVFVLSAGLVAFIFFLTLYLQNAQRFDALQAGLRLLPMTVLSGVIAPLSGRLTGRIGPRWLVALGMGAAAAGMYMVSRVSPADGQAQWIALMPAFVLVGIGLGTANAPILTVAVGTVEPGKAGVASGVNGLCRQIGTAFGIAFLGVILTAHYNGTLTNALQKAHMPPRAIAAIRAAGPNAGSTSLAQAPPSVKRQPAFHIAARDARAAWIASFVATMEVAAGVLCIGVLLAVFTISRRDLRLTDSKQSTRRG